MKNKNIVAVQNLIRCLDLSTLRDPQIVSNLVKAFGIVQWGPPVFGEDEIFKNRLPDMAGIYQIPDQISNALVYLNDFKIDSYLEIGVFQGGNFLFVSEYLRRFNPKIQCLGIDPTGYLNDEIKAIIDQESFLHFGNFTSDEIQGQKFDLVFIDGEHTGGWVKKDFDNVGRYAKICMVHDIQETTCPDIVRFWEELKRMTSRGAIEFLDHHSSIPLQGIGIIHNVINN